MLPCAMLEIRYYVAADGRQPFAEWFAGLEPVARAKIAHAIVRMEQGNLSNVKPVGGGVLEVRIDFGSTWDRATASISAATATG